jgi:hypothetical protein
MTLDFKFGSAAGRLTPEYLKSIGEPPRGAVLTVGSIGKISDACADMRAKMDSHVAKLSQTLRDLNHRLDALEKRFAPPPVVTPAPQGRW